MICMTAIFHIGKLQFVLYSDIWNKIVKSETFLSENVASKVENKW